MPEGGCGPKGTTKMPWDRFPGLAQHHRFQSSALRIASGLLDHELYLALLLSFCRSTSLGLTVLEAFTVPLLHPPPFSTLLCPETDLPPLASGCLGNDGILELRDNEGRVTFL